MRKFIKYVLNILFLSVLLIGIYLIFAISPAIFFNYNEPTRNDFLIIGHRGASELAPENSISSIKKAMELNVPRIEIDVHQTKDNQIVLMHDLTIDRTTEGEGLIKDYSYSDLLKYEIGSHFSDEFEGEKIPLLSEVLELIDGKYQLTIEVKKGNNYYPNIEENISELIKRYNAEDWVMIHSFNTSVLEEFHRLSPTLRLHKLFIVAFPFTETIFSDQLESFDFKAYDYIQEYSINYHFANERIIETLHSLGKKVNTWTVNDHQMIKDLIYLGIDGIITDNPTYAYF